MAKPSFKRVPNACECGNHAWVRLTKWGVTLVSPEDAWRLHERSWSLAGRRGTPYARSSIGYLHLQVATTTESQVVDHKNHHGLDNRRENLRVATVGQNMANLRKKSGTSSRFKGVSAVPRAHDTGWCARIKINNRSKHLGYYNTEEEAAAAYDIAAVAYHGDQFAMTNEKLGLLLGRHPVTP